MKRQLAEHLLSVIFVCAVFGLLLWLGTSRTSVPANGLRQEAEQYLAIDSVDFGDPLDAELFRESLMLYHPRDAARVDSLMDMVQTLRTERFTDVTQKSGGEEQGLTAARLQRLGVMYVQFLLMYLAVMVLSYFAARTVAIYRFVRLKQNRPSTLTELGRSLRQKPRRVAHILVLLLEMVVKGVASFVLFSPAYVIAYSFKTSFDTDSYLFMLILGVISNGLLMNYANKFFTFLVDESRKGYVDTAVVKNLNNSYVWQSGFPYRALIRPGSMLASHVFRHIYLNAQFQYRATLKEHASFLITGLIIIEMALNIQGHLGYEMLQNILYKQYDVVLAIVLGIFLLVKGTELAVDIWIHREAARYENR